MISTITQVDKSISNNKTMSENILIVTLVTTLVITLVATLVVTLLATLVKKVTLVIILL